MRTVVELRLSSCMSVRPSVFLSLQSRTMCVYVCVDSLFKTSLFTKDETGSLDEFEADYYHHHHGHYTLQFPIAYLAVYY